MNGVLIKIIHSGAMEEGREGRRCPTQTRSVTHSRITQIAIVEELVKASKQWRKEGKVGPHPMESFFEERRVWQSGYLRHDKEGECGRYRKRQLTSVEWKMVADMKSALKGSKVGLSALGQAWGVSRQCINRHLRWKCTSTMTPKGLTCISRESMPGEWDVRRANIKKECNQLRNGLRRRQFYDTQIDTMNEQLRRKLVWRSRQEWQFETSEEYGLRLYNQNVRRWNMGAEC